MEFTLHPRQLPRHMPQPTRWMPIEREMTEDDAHIIRIFFCELRQHGRKQGAVWSLIIAVFDEGHAGFF